MKVKELIELLSKLDQEKEIKAYGAFGFNFELFIDDIEIKNFKDYKLKHQFNNDTGIEDFYLI